MHYILSTKLKVLKGFLFNLEHHDIIPSTNNTTDVQSYKIALAVAHQVLSKYSMHDVTDGALFYHAYYVKPRWAREKIKTVVHEDHIFYRERN